MMASLGIFETIGENQGRTISGRSKFEARQNPHFLSTDTSLSFLAPLAEGQRAIVMAWGRRASVRPCVRASVRP